jgi:hypothetical protein
MSLLDATFSLNISPVAIAFPDRSPLVADIMRAVTTTSQ